jgi:hypothetical protein
MEKSELRKALIERIECKRKNTAERVAYKKATPVSDPSRYRTLCGFWNENAALKDQIRYLGLAYAFLRGRRYWVTERFTKDPPKAHSVAATLGDPSQEEAVKAWLEEKPSVEEVAAFEEHLAKARITARELRHAHKTAAA